MTDQTPPESVFRLQPKLPQSTLRQAVCHRLMQLHALAKLVEAQDFHQARPGVAQGYAWTVEQLVEELWALTVAIWDETSGNSN